MRSAYDTRCYGAAPRTDTASCPFEGSTLSFRLAFTSLWLVVRVKRSTRLSVEENKTPVHPSKVEAYITRIPSLKGDQSWLRSFAQRAATTALLPLELRKARLLPKERALKLHLGCGDVYLDGWINIDLAHPRKRQDLRWDLCRGLPFPDAVAEAVFAEHLFEHFDVTGGLRLLKECKRILMSKGVLRIGVPDLERYARSYLGADHLIENYRPGRPTRGIAFEEIFFFYGHRSMYDFETLDLLLRDVGFTLVERSTFGEGRLIPPPDSEERRPETLYVEAVK